MQQSQPKSRQLHGATTSHLPSGESSHHLSPLYSLTSQFRQKTTKTAGASRKAINEYNPWWHVKIKIIVGKTVSPLLGFAEPVNHGLKGTSARADEMLGSSMQHKELFFFLVFFFFLLELSYSILLVELTVLSFPWRCCPRVVLIWTLRCERAWQSQSQIPMLCSCLGKGARQKPGRSVQVPGLLIPIQKHILSLQGMHLKKQMAKIHWALWKLLGWKCSNARYDWATWDNKWDSTTTSLLVIFKRYWSPSKCEITQCFISKE